MLLRFSIAAVLGVALLAGCGGKSSAPTGSEPAKTTGTTTASKNALPADLVGTWRLVKPNPGDVVRLYLRPNAYTVSRGFAHAGQAEAKADVLTLTSVCGGSTVTGVGRYRWTLSGDKLHFEPFGKDECTGRTEVFEDATYERSG